MHPNAFLTTLWRAEVTNQVFVAMSFDSRFAERFARVIRPAIEDEPLAGIKLVAQRVDISRTGDSILTEIVSGIAHARLVLADLSVIDEGRYTQVPIRNANVMYEVGIALACRAPSAVLLVRDDNKPLLFDVSTIPIMQIDFTSETAAIDSLRKALADRLAESDFLNDARLQLAARALTQYELTILTILAGLKPGHARDLSIPGQGQPSLRTERGIAGLLGKGFARAVGINSASGGMFYELTPLGSALAEASEKLLTRLTPLTRSETPDGDTEGA